MYARFGELIELLKKDREKFANIPETTAKFDALIDELIEWDRVYMDQLEYDARFEFADPKEREVEVED